MKTLVRFAAIAAMALVVPLAGAATAPTNSLISAFAGPYNGTLSFVVFAGPTKGRFNTSKTKEVGTLTLASNVAGDGLAISFNEQLRFNKKSVVWTLKEVLPDGSGMAVSGRGRAVIKKNLITYKIPLSISGVTGVLAGQIRLATNNHLSVLETISSAGVSEILAYRLAGKKPSK